MLGSNPFDNPVTYRRLSLTERERYAWLFGMKAYHSIEFPRELFSDDEEESKIKEIQLLREEKELLKRRIDTLRLEIKNLVKEVETLHAELEISPDTSAEIMRALAPEIIPKII